MKFALSLVAVAGITASSSAAIVVTSATVRHNNVVVLDSADPGNHFTTYDGHTGVAVDIGNTSGTVRVDVGWDFNPNGPSRLEYTTSGSMRFTSVGGTFTASADFDHGTAGFNGYDLVVTQLDSGQFKRFRLLYNASLPPGTLTFPAPAGNYDLTWGSQIYTQAGQTAAGYALLNFNITPEPASCVFVTVVCSWWGSKRLRVR